MLFEDMQNIIKITCNFMLFYYETSKFPLRKNAEKEKAAFIS